MKHAKQRKPEISHPAEAPAVITDAASTGISAGIKHVAELLAQIGGGPAEPGHPPAPSDRFVKFVARGMDPSGLASHLGHALMRAGAPDADIGGANAQALEAWATSAGWGGVPPTEALPLQGEYVQETLGGDVLLVKWHTTARLRLAQEADTGKRGEAQVATSTGSSQRASESESASTTDEKVGEVGKGGVKLGRKHSSTKAHGTSAERAGSATETTTEKAETARREANLFATFDTKITVTDAWGGDSVPEVSIQVAPVMLGRISFQGRE